jgi:hypothetical protein
MKQQSAASTGVSLFTGKVAGSLMILRQRNISSWQSFRMQKQLIHANNLNDCPNLRFSGQGHLLILLKTL